MTMYYGRGKKPCNDDDVFTAFAYELGKPGKGEKSLGDAAMDP